MAGEPEGEAGGVRRGGVPWVVGGPDPYLATCERCGVREPKPQLPAPADAVVLYLRWVIEKHRLCVEGGGRGENR